MSHTIGQVKKDNQQSNSKSSQTDREYPAPENKTSETVLSETDYEFLFNQLLEGIAHGWDNHRIAKFFIQLGDRGKPEDWIAWLERLRVKILTLPIQSKRQLGTMMIRLGELTQLLPEVKQIGSVSNRIGRELLFGNTEDVIWEYVGPDLSLDSATVDVDLKMEEDLSQRLPTDFTELASDAVEDPETDLASDMASESKAEVESQPSIDTTEELKVKASDGEVDDRVESLKLEETEAEEVKTLPMADAIAPESTNLAEVEEVATHSEEFEFKTDERESVQIIDNVTDFEGETATRETDVEEPADNQLSVSESETEESPESDPDPVAIDMQQVMSLIQEDSDLAQKISQKLNLSFSKSQPGDSKAQTSQQSEDLIDEGGEQLTISDLDRSSIELIEGWFNLGLKQVSAGEFNKAIVSWEKALKINPNLSEAWHNRGSALGRLGKYQDAVESFQKALTIDPNNYQAWNDCAHALYQLQDWSAAADSWSKAIEILPGNHLFWYNRGCALEQLESWAESIASYEKSLEIKPDFQPARSRYTNLIADNSRSN